MRRSISALSWMVVGALAIIPASGQEIDIWADWAWDTSSGEVEMWALASMDYSTAYYYDACVIIDLAAWDDQNNFSSYTSGFECGSSPEAYLNVTVSQNTVDLWFDSTFNATIYYNTYQFEQYCFYNCYENWYWDAFNMFFTSGSYSGPQAFGLQGPPGQSVPDSQSLSADIQMVQSAPCVFPVNFQQTTGYDNGGGTLHFEYSWASSDGVLAHLAACRVGEYVVWPGSANPWPVPSPPFPSGIGFPNPVDQLAGTPGSAAPVPGNQGQIQDNNGVPPGTYIMSPLGITSFAGAQSYRYTCPCRNGGFPVKIYPTDGSFMSIDREVNVTSSTAGTYRITKSGISATKAVP